MMDQAVVQYAQANWIEPLNDYLNDPKLVNVEAYDMDDFFPLCLMRVLLGTSYMRFQWQAKLKSSITEKTSLRKGH